VVNVALDLDFDTVPVSTCRAALGFFVAHPGLIGCGIMMRVYVVPKHYILRDFLWINVMAKHYIFFARSIKNQCCLHNRKRKNHHYFQNCKQ
jgi:hypothetical protein